MTMEQPAIAIEGLRKSYGSVVALDGIDLQVPQGMVFGLLGPNGAGKSTVVRVLATLTVPDGGDARVGGYDVVRQRALVRSVIGMAGQYAALDEHLTGRENLELINRLRHSGATRSRARAGDLLERFGLVAAGDRRVHTYSGGMRRRLDLAASMTLRPTVLFLDEPTTGLDPRTRAELWDEIAKLVDHGATVVLTTQYLEEADHLAHRIALIGDGRIISQGTAAELKASMGSDVVELTVRDARHTSAAADALTSAGDGPCGPVRTDEIAGQVSVPVQHGEETVAAVLRRFDTLGIPIDTIELRHPTLDEAYLAATSGRAAPAVEHNGAGEPAVHSNSRIAGEGISLRSAVADTLAIARRDLRNYARNPTIMVGTILRPLLIFARLQVRAPRLGRGRASAWCQLHRLPPPRHPHPGRRGRGKRDRHRSGERDVARVVDRFRALPMARCALLAGRAISDAARNLVVIAVLTVVGFFLGFRVHTGIPQLALALLLVLAVGFAFSWITIAIAMKVKEPEAISTLAFLWSYPLTFLSSIYVPVNTMPAGIETLSRANPVTHFTDAMRALTVGTPAGRSILLSLIWIVAILAVCAPYTIRRYRLAD